MILPDQPTCFPRDVLVRVSSRDDGTVLDRAVGLHNPDVVTNRTRFCVEQGVSYGDVVFQRINYDHTQTFDRIHTVGVEDTCKYVDEVPADALITNEEGVGILLPVADCVATVIYDQPGRRLAMAHLGRHSTVADLMMKLLERLKDTGSTIEDLTIWMAPSVRQDNYRMEYFDLSDSPKWRDHCLQKEDGFYLDLSGYNRARAIEAGVLPERIHVSPVDTATDPHYFSHSQGDTTGRFAVLAMMRTHDIN